MRSELGMAQAVLERERDSLALLAVEQRHTARKRAAYLLKEIGT